MAFREHIKYTVIFLHGKGESNTLSALFTYSKRSSAGDRHSPDTREVESIPYGDKKLVFIQSQKTDLIAAGRDSRDEVRVHETHPTSVVIRTCLSIAQQ
jgi:hypothetical protein